MTTGREADPYAQGQPYQQYGNPQYGNQQYGAPETAPYATPPGRRQKSNKGTWIGLAVLLLIVVGIAVAAAIARKSDPDAASVGDCVSRSGGDSVKVVECTDPKANYKIVGKVDGKTQVEFTTSSRSICKPYPDSKTAYWKGEVGGKGYVLCLAPSK